MLTSVDIDYMDGFKVFTLGEKFPLDKMRAFIDELHRNDQHYVVMVDPGKLKWSLYCRAITLTPYSCRSPRLRCLQQRRKSRYLSQKGRRKYLQG